MLVRGPSLQFARISSHALHHTPGIDRLKYFVVCPYILSGIANVISDLTPAKKWCLRRYVTVKSGALHCFKEKIDQQPEFTMPLFGAQISLGGTGVKTDLTIRLTLDNKETVLEVIPD